MAHMECKPLRVKGCMPHDCAAHDALLRDTDTQHTRHTSHTWMRDTEWRIAGHTTAKTMQLMMHSCRDRIWHTWQLQSKGGGRLVHKRQSGCELQLCLQMRGKSDSTLSTQQVQLNLVHMSALQASLPPPAEPVPARCPSCIVG
jgi:hypothetical protein